MFKIFTHGFNRLTSKHAAQSYLCFLQYFIQLYLPQSFGYAFDFYLFKSKTRVGKRGDAKKEDVFQPQDNTTDGGTAHTGEEKTQCFSIVHYSSKKSNNILPIFVLKLPLCVGNETISAKNSFALSLFPSHSKIPVL